MHARAGPNSRPRAIADILNLALLIVELEPAIATVRSDDEVIIRRVNRLGQIPVADGARMRQCSPHARGSRRPWASDRRTECLTDQRRAVSLASSANSAWGRPTRSAPMTTMPNVLTLACLFSDRLVERPTLGAAG